MFIKKEGIDYLANFYRSAIYDKKNKTYLLTTDDGNFLFVNSSALKQLKTGKIIDENLYLTFLAKGIIVNENNFNKIVQKTAKRYGFLGNGTSLHIVIPTHRCNLGCTYCFASATNITDSKEENDLDEKTAKKIIEFIMTSPSSAITIEFQGGEATARFDTVQLMSLYAKELNKKYKKDLKITIVTNLTLMNEKIANWLIDNDITICTSFDGPKNVHDKNRFIKAKEGIQVGTYDQVIFWINRINKLYEEKNKPYRVNALMTITKHSLAYYKEILDEYVKLKIEYVNIRSLTEVGRATENSEEILYTKQDFTKFYEDSVNYLKELYLKGIKISERTLEMYAQKILLNTPTYHADFESPCGAATGQITYHNNGNIYTCNEALGRDEFKIGNVFEDNWKGVFQKKETAKAILNSMLESNVKCDRCVFKPYCGTCMVENYYHLGKFNFYPTKTTKHHETVYQCKNIFDQILNNINQEDIIKLTHKTN